MSLPTAKFAIRRILVALDASPYSLAALDMAVDLAATMQAELAGLFVEDVELLRMAELSSAREIAYPAATGTALSRSIMERKFRAQSEQIRNKVAAAAHRAQVPWSFRTVRGQVTSELRAAVSKNDIIAVGRLGWSFGRRLRIGSTALDLATSSIPMLLISQRAALGSMRLLVYYDGSPPSRNSLLFAAKIASGGANGLTVLVRAANYEGELADIQHLLEDLPLDFRCRRIGPDQKTSLVRAVKEEGPVLIVLADRQLLQDREGFQTLLNEVEAPLLLLGDGLAHEDGQSSIRAAG